MLSWISETCSDIFVFQLEVRGRLPVVSTLKAVASLMPGTYCCSLCVL